jgi:hypothetical protein
MGVLVTQKGHPRRLGGAKLKIKTTGEANRVT